MPVEVSLELVVRLPGTEGLLPDELRGLLAKLEENTDERSQWGVVADWLDENGEPRMARACRYVMKRPAIKAHDQEKSSSSYSPHFRWVWKGLPSSVEGITLDEVRRFTLVSLIAELALKLAKHDEDGT